MSRARPAISACGSLLAVAAVLPASCNTNPTATTKPAADSPTAESSKAQPVLSAEPAEVLIETDDQVDPCGEGDGDFVEAPTFSYELPDGSYFTPHGKWYDGAYVSPSLTPEDIRFLRKKVRARLDDGCMPRGGWWMDKPGAWRPAEVIGPPKRR